MNSSLGFSQQQTQKSWGETVGSQKIKKIDTETKIPIKS